MGFNVTLVHGLGLVLVLKDYVGFPETLFHVAQPVLQVAGDVALDPGVLTGGRPGPCGNGWSCPRELRWRRPP